MTEVAELTQSLEDYLEAIYALQRGQDTVRVKEIADSAGVSMPSARSFASA